MFPVSARLRRSLGYLKRKALCSFKMACGTICIHKQIAFHGAALVAIPQTAHHCVPPRLAAPDPDGTSNPKQ